MLEHCLNGFGAFFEMCLNVTFCLVLFVLEHCWNMLGTVFNVFERFETVWNSVELCVNMCGMILEQLLHVLMC